VTAAFLRQLLAAILGGELFFSNIAAMLAGEILSNRLLIELNVRERVAATSHTSFAPAAWPLWF